jgi:hypothetical protein
MNFEQECFDKMDFEQEFYRVFGIGPNVKTIPCYGGCKIDGFESYPEITAEKLLEMICVLNKEAVYGYSDWGGNFVIGETVEELKKSILTDCIRNKSKVFKQIQQLFKE